MRIAITGATGFLGSHLVRELLERGHEIALLIRPGSSTWRLADVLGRVECVEGCLEEIGAARAALGRFAPQAVAHLAWRGVGNTDRNDPSQARNVPSTVELAALCADIGAEVFVGAGSQAEYGPHSRPIREDDETRPTTLYGKAKLAAGGMAAQVAGDRGMRFAWLRIFSTYGARDADHWLIPGMIGTLRAGRRMSLTRCEQRWSFLHARDAASAWRAVIENRDAAGIYNLGHPEAPALRDTVTMLRDLVDPNADLGFGEVPYRPDQVMVLQPDVGRLAALGWEPRVPIDVGLRETVEWYDAAQRN